MDMEQPTSSKQICKLFLLNVVTYTGDKPDPSDEPTAEASHSQFYSEILNVFSKSYPHKIKGIDPQEVYYEGKNSYSDGNIENNLDNVGFKNSLSSARSLSMAMLEELNIDLNKCKSNSNFFAINDVKASVFFNAHAFIFLGYEITLEYANQTNIKGLIQEIFKDRDLFQNLGLSEVHNDNSKYLIEKLHSICQQNGLNPRKGDIKLELDNTLPALFLPKATCDLYELFRNEETRNQFESNRVLMCSNDEDYFFHVGWNYTVAAGFPREVFRNLLHVITACQGYFFTLFGLKGYYTHELKRVIENSEKLSSFHVEKAESVQLAFAHTTSSFHEYKSRLFPKYREEVNNILERWNCNEDVEKIKDLIDLDLQAKQKKNSKRVESVLFALALFQLLGMFGILSEIKKQATDSISTFSMSFFAIMSITVFLMMQLKGLKKIYSWSLLLFCTSTYVILSWYIHRS